MATDKDIYELQKEVHNQLKSSTEKFCYYLIALSVSSLGFVVFQTKEDVIDCPKILLLIAVIFWLASIFFGMNFIKKQQQGLVLSYRSYDNARNQFEPSKNDPQKTKWTEEIIKDKFRLVDRKSRRNYKYQLYTFFLAVLFYIVWHALEMYDNTYYPSS
jgi:hypothetical protein